MLNMLQGRTSTGLPYFFEVDSLSIGMLKDKIHVRGVINKFENFFNIRR